MKNQRAIIPKRVQVMPISARESKANNIFLALTALHSIKEKQPFAKEQCRYDL
jgi:hypothetical protein